MRIQKQNLDGLTKANETDMTKILKNPNNENANNEKPKFKLPKVCQEDPYIVKLYRSLVASTEKTKENSTESEE